MAMPDLSDEGFLPERVHACSLDEFQRPCGLSSTMSYRGEGFANGMISMSWSLGKIHRSTLSMSSFSNRSGAKPIVAKES
jgi:hypothetical protein